MVPERARALIAAERDAALARLATLRGEFDSIVAASRDTNADDEHDPEGATIAFERSQVDSLVALTRRQVDELDAALARVDAGTYGTCASCGKAVPDARLEVRPAARTCVACA